MTVFTSNCTLLRDVMTRELEQREEGGDADYILEMEFALAALDRIEAQLAATSTVAENATVQPTQPAECGACDALRAEVEKRATDARRAYFVRDLAVEANIHNLMAKRAAETTYDHLRADLASAQKRIAELEELARNVAWSNTLEGAIKYRDVAAALLSPAKEGE